MLTVNEVSQVGGLTLACLDMMRIVHLAASPFFSDFFPFDPVRQTSLLPAEPKDSDRQRPESLARHAAAHKLFFQFTAGG
jgi:hypothetical protein